jgi:hypothetical protein
VATSDGSVVRHCCGTAAVLCDCIQAAQNQLATRDTSTLVTLEQLDMDLPEGTHMSLRYWASHGNPVWNAKNRQVPSQHTVEALSCNSWPARNLHTKAGFANTACLLVCLL